MKNATTMIVGQININLLRNKLEMLKYCMKGNAHILLISGTKLDGSFSFSLFVGFSIQYTRDRYKNWSDILLYVREDIPSKLLKSNDSTI